MLLTWVMRFSFKSAARIWAGATFQSAYESIGYERDAYRLQENILVDINEKGNPCDPSTINGKRYSLLGKKP